MDPSLITGSSRGPIARLIVSWKLLRMRMKLPTQLFARWNRCLVVISVRAATFGGVMRLWLPRPGEFSWD